MLQLARITVSITLFASLLTSPVHAGQRSVADDLSATTGRLLTLVDQLQLPSQTELSRTELLRQVSGQRENLLACRLLLAEQMRNRETRLQGGSAVARDRQQAFSTRLRNQLEVVDDQLRRLGSAPQSDAVDLQMLAQRLSQFTQPAQPSLHGTIPYRQQRLTTITPRFSPSLNPASHLATADFTPADLQAAPEAPLSQIIYQQAQTIAASAGKQNWDPVDLYEWVKNNIHTEWYWGSMKGAEETLRQRSGNDADQAALLIALLRAAGYPARYVRGVVEFFPDLDMARRLTGIDDAARLGDFFRQAGIPHQPMQNGNEIINYQLEHIWVETLVPYANYRGSLADMEGKLWLPLDTSCKVASFTESGSLDLYGLPGQPLPALRDAYLENLQEQTPMEFLREQVSAFLAVDYPEVAYNALLHRRSQRAENLRILSTAPQFTEVVVTGEYSALPADLIHTLRLTAVDDVTGSTPVFDITLPTRTVSNRLVQISFEAASVEDQETINLWGGLDNTPAYLVHLRPVLIVDGVRTAVGRTGFAVGKSFSLTLALQSPSARVEAENRLVVGYPHLLAIVAQEVLLPAEQSAAGGAVDLLYRTALDYVDRWNHDEEEIAALLNLKLARPVPSLVSLSGMMQVTELLGVPQSVVWTGLFLDADIRVAEVVERTSSNDDRLLAFMKLSALQGSVLEHKILEDHFQVESISTAKLFGLAGVSGLPLVTVNAENIDTLLPELALNGVVAEDISAAVAAGMIVRIPSRPLTYHAWSGIGYLKEFAETGEAGYMLSGSIAGGSTVMGREFWYDMPLRQLEAPFTGEPNNDPDAADHLVALTPWQIRWATAGKELDGELMVRVQDAIGTPVSGAPVLFSVAKGGGVLLDGGPEPTQFSSLTVLSGGDGIARARFIPGESVFANPVAVARPGQAEANIAGENLIDVRLASGTFATLETLIAVLGFAGLPDAQKSHFQGGGNFGYVHSFAGLAGVLLADRFGNPVANYAVNMTALPAVALPFSSCSPENVAPALLLAEIIDVSAACLKQLPVRGECGSAQISQTVISRSDGGAMVGVILGGLPNAGYPLGISFVNDSTATYRTTLSLRSAGGACRSSGDPQEVLLLNYPTRKDAAGRNVDARAAGSRAQIAVKSYLLHEGTALLPKGDTLSCAPSPDKNCDRIVATGTFSLKAPDQVLSGSQLLERIAGGSSSLAAPYLYGLDVEISAGLNLIPLTAVATFDQQEIVNACSQCGTVETVTRSIGSVEQVVEIWGVSLEVPEALTVPVDHKGILTRAVNIPFTILPLEYTAGFAQMLIFADGKLWETLIASTSGSAQVTLPQGYLFHPLRSYDVQLLLGHPGDVNAIYSSRFPIHPVHSTVDLQIEGLPDLLEGQIGAFVLLNNDYDEQDADPSVTLPDAETPGMILADDELKRAWLHIDDPNMLGGSWQLRASEPSRLRLFAAQGENFVELKADDPPQLITATPLSIPLYLEGLAESTGLHADSLTLTYVASQAALSSSFFEKDVMRADPVITPFTIETPEVYGNYPGNSLQLPYLNLVSSKVINLVSYFNIDDYALTGDNYFSPRWEVNNHTKPDGLLRYSYQGGTDAYPPEVPNIGFFQWRTRLDESGESEDYKHQLTFPLDDFAIYAFSAESRTRALGALRSPSSFLPESTVENKGSRNLAADDYDENRYSHSRQFRSNIVDEQYFWGSFIKDSEMSRIDGR